MFGYLRPLQGELKVRELERFRACYCGLCHALGKKYGASARFVISYELVFLAMLLWDEGEPVDIKRKRCIASPFRKRRYCTPGGSLGTCAGYNVILTWWKLKDSINDEPFFKSVPHRLASLFLSRAYKKAAREFPEFDRYISREMAALAEYEAGADVSLDGAADKFAKMLCAAAPESACEGNHRPLMEILYHLGRWI